jgi:hypothetical protein
MYYPRSVCLYSISKSNVGEGMCVYFMVNICVNPVVCSKCMKKQGINNFGKALCIQ